jgi:hypothetical protein
MLVPIVLSRYRRCAIYEPSLLDAFGAFDPGE